MSPDRALIANVWQLLKMKLKRIYELSIFDFRNEAGMEAFGRELGYYTCT